MSSPVLQPAISTLADYYRAEALADGRSEFDDGKIVAMSGATFPHIQISANLAHFAGRALDGKRCQIYGSDLRVRIPSRAKTYYPDATILCQAPLFDPENPTAAPSVMNPSVVFEILSPSSEQRDRVQKFLMYGLIPELREYVLIHQRAAHVEVFRRQEGGAWQLRFFVGLNASMELEAPAITLPLSQLYHGVVFPPS